MKQKDKIEELFQAIESSNEYKSYLNIGKILDNNKEVKTLVSEIKKLQQQSVKLEYEKNSKYKEIDKIIEEKVAKLNSIPIYKEYLRRMDEFNNILAESSSTIEKYINSKV